MKRIILLCLTAVCTTLMAAERSQKEMQDIAKRHFATSSEVKVKTGHGTVAEAPRCVLSADEYSVFASPADESFVIVSKSDLTSPVIGYAQGRFADAATAPGLRWYLSLVERNIQQAEASHQPLGLTTVMKADLSPVEPFITTHWHQSDPFNLKTPNNYPAGCVAVALAQCINYCRYPSSTKFRGYCYYTQSATSTRYTVDSLDINDIYFYPYLDLYGRATDGQKKSVATLLRDCGYATYMQYAKSGSGTYLYEAGIALTTRFSYPQECIKYAERSAFGGSQDEWNQIIYDEIRQLCPVIYGGQDENEGGHAFVLCGLDADGLVYVNWGWGSDGDGYYDISLMNPSDMQFSEGQDMIYGIRKEPLANDRPEPRIYSYDGQPYTFSFAEEKGDDGKAHVALHITFNAGMVNMSPATLDGEFGLFGTDVTTGKVWQIKETDPETWEPGVGYFLREPAALFYYYVEKDLVAGHTYRISFGSRDKREGLWHSVLCDGGEIGYEIQYTGDAATSTISEVMEPLYDGISTLEADGPSVAGALTQVYDASGRLVYSTPSESFNLWDVPARGLLIVKQGNETRKIVR